MKNYRDLIGDNSLLSKYMVYARRTCEHATMLAGLIQNQSITSGFHPTSVSTSSFDLPSVFGKDMRDAGLSIFFHLSALEFDICNITRLARARELPKKESCPLYLTHARHRLGSGHMGSTVTGPDFPECIHDKWCRRDNNVDCVL